MLVCAALAVRGRGNGGGFKPMAEVAGDLDNNLFTQIGFVVLIGLACKNAILIVEFARGRQRKYVADPRSPIYNRFI